MTNHDNAPAAPSIAADEIQFIDDFLPTLDPGTYSIQATQSITSGLSGAPDFGHTMDITVGGAGLVLGAANIASVYPPASSRAEYGNVLPHIVLNVRTLPWENRLHLTPEDKSVPWLALILVADGEGVTSTTVAANALGNVPSKTVPPQPPAPEVANTTAPVTVIDIPALLFPQIMPNITEVAYLAHCRQVNIAQKSASTNGVAAPGWYSVVVANRFPRAAGNADTTQYTAHLVCIAGLEPYLPGALPEGTKFVRVVSLYHWSFSTIAQGLDFRALMTNLVTPPAGTLPGDSSHLLLRLPPRPATASTDEVHQAVARVLHAGYVSLPYVTRQGDQVSGWYRGPFTPAPTETISLRPIALGSAALVYDQHSGMFDISYAVAWETGRMVALADSGFATALNNWRVQGQQLLQQLQHNLRQQPLLAAKLYSEAESLAGEDVLTLFKPNVRQARVPATNYAAPVLTVLLNSVAPSDKAAVSASLAADPALFAAAESEDQLPSAALGKLNSQAWVANAITQLTDGATDTVTEWLARLALVYGVPFDTMVPDRRMLPPESLRFFYIDQTWIHVLIDGALSVGVRSGRDASFNQMMQPLLQNAVQRKVGALRAKHMGSVADPPAVSTPVCGFLMRSAIVSGWPNLEVRAYQPNGHDLMQPLRIEHLSQDVLLVLWPVMPSKVEISEPHESLRFGTEDDGIIDLRSVSASNPGAQLQKSATVAYRRDIDPVVLDVTQTRQAIADQATELKDIGSAGFAVQMVAAPEQMVFWGAGS